MSVTAVPLQPVKRAYKVWLWIGVLAAIALAFGLAWIGTRAAVAAKGTNEQFLAWNKGQPGVITTASGLEYQVLKEGKGAKPNEGDYVVVNYEGHLRDGSVFDRSERPVPFPIQPNSAIPGFLEGLKLTQLDGKYRFWIPAKLAYGAPGVQSPDPDKIGPDTLLIFDVSVVRILPAAIVQQMMMQQMMQQQGGAQGGPQGGPPAGSEAGPPPPPR